MNCIDDPTMLNIWICIVEWDRRLESQVKPVIQNFPDQKFCQSVPERGNYGQKQYIFAC